MFVCKKHKIREVQCLDYGFACTQKREQTNCPNILAKVI